MCVPFSLPAWVFWISDRFHDTSAGAYEALRVVRTVQSAGLLVDGGMEPFATAGHARIWELSRTGLLSAKCVCA
jgi:hypothetical protein